MPFEHYEPGRWAVRAMRLLQQAIDEVSSNEEAFGTVDMAMACLRAEAGELPADEAQDLDEHLTEQETGKAPASTVAYPQWLRIDDLEKWVGQLMEGRPRDPGARYILRVHPDVHLAITAAAIGLAGAWAAESAATVGHPAYGKAELEVATDIGPGGWALYIDDGVLVRRGQLTTPGKDN